MSDFMNIEDASVVFGAYATQIKKMKPSEITWAAYQALTPQQQTAGRYIITDYPLYGDEICEIKGSYDTLAELETAHPAGDAGDAYLVGSPSHVYVWTVDDAEWSDAGAFTAVTGPQGPKGNDGVGISSTTINAQNHLIITYTDGTTQDAGELSSGTITVDSTLSPISTNPVQNKVITGALQDAIWVGTQAQWAALSTAEKAKHQNVFFTDDVGEDLPIAEEQEV